ncbi:MAG: NADH-quinone oxidoreductase subunit NuoK [Planctomycetota bacterium]|jgi:NADH-quinone oxidoreductase subunit K
MSGLTDGLVPMLGAIEAFSAARLSHFLLLSAVLFTLGVVGFLTRRNMIVMFLCTELMFQAAAIAFIAFGRFHHDVSGQVFVIFILTIAAAEAALALGLVVLLHRRTETLNTEAWAELRD